MSRCFPYRPPGGARSETVYESIKLQRERERERPVTEYSKEKTGKKERRESKKENKVDKIYQGKKRLPPKEREDEAEKSGLSEEHGQPVSLQGLCDLSDDTQSNRNMKKDHLASNDVKIQGNIIRIRLPLRKKSQPHVSHSGEQMRPTSGRADSLCLQNDIVCIPGQEQCSSMNSKAGAILEEPTSRPEKASCSLDSKRKTSRDAGTSFGISMCENGRQITESPYEALIQDWVAPSLQFELNDFSDQEWLFGTKKQEKDRCKRFKACHEDVSCPGSSTMWPRAQHLPEVDVYALPYAIPF